jgi:hypothetical protein
MVIINGFTVLLLGLDRFSVSKSYIQSVRFFGRGISLSQSLYTNKVNTRRHPCPEWAKTVHALDDEVTAIGFDVGHTLKLLKSKLSGHLLELVCFSEISISFKPILHKLLTRWKKTYACPAWELAADSHPLNLIQNVDPLTLATFQAIHRFANCITHAKNYITITYTSRILFDWTFR